MTTIRLAPMAGITDWPFRLLCFEQGCDLAYTEMISAMGYLCAKPTNVATQQLLAVNEGEGQLYAQVFGKEPDLMAKASDKIIQTGNYLGIDINMGCPAHKVAGSGEGSGLMKTPRLAGQIMVAVRNAVPLPVTVKMRLGWDDESINVLEMAHIAQESGMDAITIHGRTRKQQYSGKADWDQIAKVKQALTIPVYGNGDVFTAEDGIALLKQTACDGILVGRGAMGNPWIFSQLKEILLGRKPSLPTLEMRVNTAVRHLNMMVDWKGERIGVKEMRKHVSWYITGVRGAAQLRVRANSAKSKEEMEQALYFCLEQDLANKTDE